MGNCSSNKSRQNEALSEIQDLTKKQIESMKAKIDKTDDKYTLKAETLSKLFHIQNAHKIIHQFDFGQLGYIDTYDFYCFLIIESCEKFEVQSDMLFNLYDQNGDQVLTREECQVLIRCLYNSLQVTDPQATITDLEIQESLQKFYDEADSNCDNVISKSEWRQYLKQDKGILASLTRTGAAETRPLGKEFGVEQHKTNQGEVMWIPLYDEDLEAETEPVGKDRDARNEAKRNIVKEEPSEFGEFEQEIVEQGDQFLCTRQTFKAPDGYRPSKNQQPPTQDLDLEYVYGYRCHDARNNVRYSNNGDIIYHTAALGIKLNPQNNTQTFFNNHRDDIHGFDVSSDGTLAITGEIGPKPRLCLWDIRTMSLLDEVRAPLTKGIMHCCFNHDCTLVAASDLSDDHSIAIFSVSSNKKLVRKVHGKGTRAVIMSLAFAPNEETLVATCVKEVKFFQFNTSALKSTKGSGWGKTPADTVLSNAYVGNTLFTGTLGGEIISWSGSSISKRVKAHTKKVNAMHSQGDNLISGSHDGTIIIWQTSGTTITEQRRINLADLSTKKQPINTMVISVQLGQRGQILFGTRGGDICQLNQNNLQVLMRAHYNKELWGLTLHPNQQNVASFDDNGNLNIWDVNTRTQRFSFTLPCGGDVASYSPDGQYLALGQSNGTLIILDGNNYISVKERNDRKGKEVSALKWSPNGQYLAVGGQDQKVIIYNVENNFSIHATFNKFSSRVLFIDWQLDGRQFQALSQAYELLYFDNEAKKQNPRSDSFRNETWATWSSSLGWPVTGVWPKGADGSDINSVDRSPDHSMIATADDFGTVKIFNYPAAGSSEDKNKVYFGHSSHVTRVEFSKWQGNSHQYLFSTGGEDKSLFQWRVLAEGQSIQRTQQAQARPISAQIQSRGEKQMQSQNNRSMSRPQTSATMANTYSAFDINDRDVPEVSMDVQKLQNNLSNFFGQEEEKEMPKKKRFQDNDMMGGFEEEKEEQGDQILAVQPWKSAVKHMAPKVEPKIKASKRPIAAMTMKWAFGFRSFDTKNNLFYNAQGEAVYSTAGVGIIHDIEKQEQRFANYHKEDIVAVAISPDRSVVATGQMASKDMEGQKGRGRGPKFVQIILWDASTTEQVGAPINGVVKGAVRHLQFSPDGKYIFGIGEDDKYTMGVYEVEEKMNNVGKSKRKTRALVWEGSTDMEAIKSACFDQKSSKIGLVSAKNKLSVDLSSAKSGGKAKNEGRADKNEPFSAVAFDSSDQMVVGTKNGNIFFKNTPTKAHTGAVYLIRLIDNKLYSSGQDGLILEWNGTTSTKVFAFDSVIPDHLGVTAFDIQNQKMLVGCKGAVVVQVQNKQAQIINQGHYKDPTLKTYQEVWGCAASPKDANILISAGGDRYIRMWFYDRDGSQTKQIKQLQLENDVTALDWSDDGKWICAGDREGTISIINAQTFQVVDKIETDSGDLKPFIKGKTRVRGWDAKTGMWVEICRFSPNGKYVAYGHHGYGTYLQLIELNGQGKKVAKAKNKQNNGNLSSSAINHIDWSIDNENVIFTNTGYEVRAFKVGNGCTLIDNKSLSSLRDTTWKTWSLNLGWPVQGIYGKCIDYTDINTVERSHDNRMIATGWDSGEIKLHNWPCLLPNQSTDSYYGHSAHVTKVKWGASDDFIFSTGGGDMTVFVWDTDLNDQVQISQDPDAIVDRGEKPGKEAKAALKAGAAKRREGKVLDASDDEDDTETFGQFKLADPGAGDEFLAVKPCKGQMKPPTLRPKPPKDSMLPPDIGLEIEWVYGYRGYDNRNNIAFFDNGCLYYYVAGVVIKYDPVQHTQKHFIGHTDDVMAIAFHPAQKWIASGELGDKPKVFIIDPETMEQKQVIQAPSIRKSVLCMAFSQDGAYLAVVTKDDDHTITVISTKDEDPAKWSVLCSEKGDRKAIYDIDFSTQSNQFYIIGVGLFKEFTIEGNRLKAGRNASFATTHKDVNPNITCCMMNTSGQCLTGNVVGDLYKWSGNTPSPAVKGLHSRRLDAILIDGQYIFTGGKDCMINVLSLDYNKLFSIDLTKLEGSVNSQVRALSLNKEKNTLYVGTFGSEFVQIPIDLQGKTHGQAKVLTHGHYAPGKPTNEVWGLSTGGKDNRGQDNLIFTCSDDATVRVWDVQKRRQVACVPLDEVSFGVTFPMEAQGRGTNVKDAVNSKAKGRAIDISPDGTLMAIGTFGGLLRMFKLEGGQWTAYANCEIQKGIHKMEWIQDLKFSPDGTKLAVSSHNDRLYVFTIVENNQPQDNPFDTWTDYGGKSSSFITQLDWSLDSKFIRTNDASYEILYYDADNMRDNIKRGATQFRDEPWATNTCILTWNTQSVWEPGMDGSDINYCDVNGDRRFIATATDKGEVCVYKYPADTDSNAEHIVGKGHSSHVTKVKFSGDSTRLYSAGGNDTAIIQWKVSKGLNKDQVVSFKSKGNKPKGMQMNKKK